MAIKSADQISIVDLTDAYSVILTNDSYTFPGTTAAAKAGSCTTQVIAMCGAEQVSAAVDLNAITKPTGITVTKDTDATAPTLTVTASTSFTTAGVVKIPITIDGDITITKDFSVAIAFTGATGATGSSGGRWYSGTGITGTSTTATVFSGSGVTSAVVGDMYLNTSTYNTYRCTTAGAASAAKWVYTANIKGSTGSTGPTGAAGGSIWSTTVAPSTSGTTYTFTNTNLTGATGTPKVGDTILQSYYYYTITSVTSTTSVCANTRISIRGATGATGAAGADAITMSVTSSNGTIFKNSSIETTLTAHVYKAGVEVTGSDLTALGTIKWYKDGSTTAAATGQTLNISAGDVSNKATYIAQLEG